MDKYDNLCSAILALQKNKDKFDPLYLDALGVKMTEVLTTITGNYLHGLYNSKPQEETLKMMIDTVPSALFHRNIKGQIPLQSAVWHNDSVKYMPLLAKEGLRLKMIKGGLLFEDPFTGCLQPKKLSPSPSAFDRCPRRKKENALQLLAHLQNVNNPLRNDEDCLEAIIELRRSNLLVMEDVEKHSLLFWACGPTSELRFKFLNDWCKGGLKRYRVAGLPIVHAIIDASKSIIDRFAVFLKYSIEHYPDEIGLLFQKNAKGETALERAINMYGKDATFKTIEEYIPRGDIDLPILHYVAENTPQYQNDFAMRYASTAFLRDSKGRKLYQAELASGSKSFQSDATYFVKLTDDEVQDIDPGTGLYPFMLLASGETSDLSAIYYLLRRSPSLATPCTGSRNVRKRKTNNKNQKAKIRRKQQRTKK